MPQQRTMAQMSVAANLIRLAREFKSGDQLTATAIRREFKDQSKNDCTRTIVYLMEVIGSRDEQFKRLESDNKDLREILKLNDINLDEALEKLPDEKNTPSGSTAEIIQNDLAATNSTGVGLGTETTEGATNA